MPATRDPKPATSGQVPQTHIFERGPALEVHPRFAKDFADFESFDKSALAGTLAPYGAQSSLAIARTRYPLVLVRVVDDAAIPLPDIRLELRDETDTFIDAVISDSIGLGLLRFPAEPPESGAPELKGKVRVDGVDDHEVVIAAQEDFVVLHVTRSGVTADDEADRHDSVIPRLPAFFSVKAADEIVRHRVTGDGPDPAFAAAVGRQTTYRAPQVRWVYARRTVLQPHQLPRKLYVRIRQEWHFVGHSFGQPERIDSRDVASIVGSLDASIAAQLAVSAGLDLTTDSTLSADASARLRAAASLHGELDLNAGLHLFEGGLGNPLSVSGDADLSIETSLLVSAQLKLRASLRNQLHARASLNGRASVGLEADASIAINPSLARELNIPRFVIHENFVVTSFVEDVQEIREVQMFEDPSEKTLVQLPKLPFFPFPFPLPHPPLFPPADVVEYRPIFERQLLEPLLASRFRALRVALDSAAGQGPLVRHLRFDVTYAATTSGRFSVNVLGHSATIKLEPGQSQARLVLQLPGGQFLDVLQGNNAEFHVTLGLFDLITEGSGSVKITSITAHSDAAPEGSTVALQPDELEASTSDFTDSKIWPMQLRTPDAGLLEDPLVVHINRNATYYMGLLVKAALANPSLRFDVPQLQKIGSDSVLWKLPIHGFAGNKALVLVPATGEDVRVLLTDLGRGTVVQLAVDGNWSEAMQANNFLEDLVGKLFPALETLDLPLELLEALTSGTGLVPAIVDAAGTVAGIGSAAGAVTGVGGVVGGVLGAVSGALDVP